MQASSDAGKAFVAMLYLFDQIFSQSVLEGQEKTMAILLPYKARADQIEQDLQDLLFYANQGENIKIHNTFSTAQENKTRNQSQSQIQKVPNKGQI